MASQLPYLNFQLQTEKTLLLFFFEMFIIMNNNQTKVNFTGLTSTAGMLFRRIVLYVKPGQYLPQNSKLGKILFGSRVDIYIPIIAITKDRKKISVGQKISAGKTIIGFYEQVNSSLSQ